MADWAGALAQRLQPAADTRLVVAVGVAKAPLEICLLARDDDVAHGDRQRQREIQDKAQKQAAEMEEWRSRYDARGYGITRLLVGRAHVCSCLPGNAPKVRIAAGVTTRVLFYLLTI